MSGTLQARRSLEEVYEWLQEEAERQHLKAKFYTNSAEIRNDRLIVLPVYLDEITDAYDFAHKLQELENAWNDQEPDPGWSLFIRPASKK